MTAPIVDAHIHIFQVSRPGGVPWPSADNATLYEDMLPARYRAEAGPLGVVGAGIVEASPLPEDTAWMLEQIAGDPSFFYVAQIGFDDPDFDSQLAAIAKDPRVVGVRGFLWNPALRLDEQQLTRLRALADRGMTLDLISRRTFNPKETILRLADAVPSLRIILDHLGGAVGGPVVDPVWAEQMRLLAERPNVHLKLSALFDMWNATGDESRPWSAPKDARSYAPQLDVALEAFGPDRVIFGSNWPVCNLAGTLAEEIQIAEACLSAHGRSVRDRVMHDNARRFYRRGSAATRR